MNMKKTEARERIAALVLNAKGHRQQDIRFRCLAVYDRWAAGEPVDLVGEIAKIDATDRDDCAEPVLAALMDCGIL